MRIVTLIVALAMPLQAGEASKSGWKEFRSKEGGFSVLMPGTPAEEDQSHDSRIGPIRSRMFVVDRGTSGFIAGYDDYPEAVLKLDSKSLLDGTRDAIVAGMKGELLDRRGLEQDGHAGQEFAVKMPDGSAYKARLFRVKTKLCLAATVMPGARADSEEVKTFLESFKLTTDEPAPRAGAATRPDRTGREDWRRLDPPGGGFSILMPGTPDERKQTVDSAIGPLRMRGFTRVNGLDEFTVMLTDYPAAILKSKPETILDGVRIGAEAELRGKVLDERPTSLDGHPGRQFTLELPESNLPGGGLYRTRAYLVGQRLYQVVTLTPRANASSEDVKTFFRSFRLSARK